MKSDCSSAFLGNLNNNHTIDQQNWAVEVRKLWGQTALDVQYFTPDKERIVVGEDQDAEFFIPADLLPDQTYPIARVVCNQVIISFNHNARGQLKMPDGTTMKLCDLAQSPLVAYDPECFGCQMFSLPQGAIATISYGNLSLRFKYVSKPAAFLSKLADKIDYALVNTIIVVLFICAATLATFHLRAEQVNTDEESLHKVPGRYLSFILNRPKAPQKEIVLQKDLNADFGAQSNPIAPKHKRKEGKMGIEGIPDNDRRSAVRAIKPEDREAIGKRGLLGALGTGGPAGLSTVTGGSGLGGELHDAVGGMFGSSIGSSGGFGGLGLKGTHLGGGGISETIGLDGIGYHWSRPVLSPYRRKLARVSRPAERDVDITIGKLVHVGPLSMATIRREIKSHRNQIRYCYEQELTRLPNLRGKITVKFTIGARGYVTQVSITQTSLNNAAVEGCVVSKIRTWRFPKPMGGGTVIVNYPFIFSSK
jgi:TonB family protein